MEKEQKNKVELLKSTDKPIEKEKKKVESEKLKKVVKTKKPKKASNKLSFFVLIISVTTLALVISQSYWQGFVDPLLHKAIPSKLVSLNKKAIDKRTNDLIDLKIISLQTSVLKDIKNNIDILQTKTTDISEKFKQNSNIITGIDSNIYEFKALVNGKVNEILEGLEKNKAEINDGLLQNNGSYDATIVSLLQNNINNLRNDLNNINDKLSNLTVKLAKVNYNDDNIEKYNGVIDNLKQKLDIEKYALGKVIVVNLIISDLSRNLSFGLSYYNNFLLLNDLLEDQKLENIISTDIKKQLNTYLRPYATNGIANLYTIKQQVIKLSPQLTSYWNNRGNNSYWGKVLGKVTSLVAIRKTTNNDDKTIEIHPVTIALNALNNGNLTETYEALAKFKQLEQSPLTAKLDEILTIINARILATKTLKQAEQNLTDYFMSKIIAKAER